VPSMNRPDLPEFPPAGARIDYYLATQPGDVKLEIVDASGQIVRSVSNTPAPAAGGRGGRRGGAPAVLPVKAGMNRFLWDLRYANAPAGAAGTGQGPLVAPGSYRARLTVGGVTKTEPLVVKIDPRVAKDGVTAADLAEQTKFALKVRDALADARQVSQRVRQALDGKRGDQSKLQAVWERLVTKSGPYEDQMFLDQLANVAREISQADQKVGASAFERFNELVKEWATLKTDAESALR